MTNPTPEAQGEWLKDAADAGLQIFGGETTATGFRMTYVSEAELITVLGRLREVTDGRDENGRIAHQQTVLVKAQQAKLKAQEQELLDTDSRFIELAERLNGKIASQEQELERLRGSLEMAMADVRYWQDQAGGFRDAPE